MDRRTLLRAGIAAATSAGVGACAATRPTDAGPPTAGEPEASDGSTRHAYGSDPSQYGDLYLPEGSPAGVAVVIHGGFWTAAYGAEYGQPLAVSLRDRGWIVWNVEYRRVGGGGGVPETLDDVTAAIAKVDDPALGVDRGTRPVVGIGHSAGGHLAAVAGAGGTLTQVVSQAGVLDLRAAAGLGLGGGAVEDFLGHNPTDADADLDPIRMVPLPVPVWCVHGRQDTIVPATQSRDYVAAARAAGGTAQLVEVEGDHFTLIDVTSPAWRRTLQILDGIQDST